MIGKIVVLFFVAAAFGNPLKEVTPEEAKENFATLDERVVFRERLVAKEISGSEAALDYAAQKAKTSVNDDLEDAAASYREAIASLESAAEQNGKDISSCVNDGNGKLNQLNDDITSALTEAVNSNLYQGLKIINSATDSAANTLLELAVLRKLVDQCDNTACATNLDAKAKDYLERAFAVLDDAEQRAANYATEYFAELIAPNKVNKESYQAQSNAILSDVESCVNSL